MVVFLVFLSVQFSAVHCAVHMQLTHDFHNDWITIVNFGSRKSFHHHPATSYRVPKPARATVIAACQRPNRNPLVKSLDAWMTAWVLRVASSCFDSLVRCSALELCLFPLGRRSERDDFDDFLVSMESSFAVATDQSHSTGRSDVSIEVEETSAEEDQDWNDDSDADWTIDSEGHSSLSEGSVCALVASDGQRR